MFTLLYVPARFRRPVRLLECPDRTSLLAPEDCGRPQDQTAAGAGAGLRMPFRRVFDYTFWRLGFR